MFDLLSTLPESMQIAAQMSALTVAEDETGVYVKGLSCHLVQNEEEALNLLFEVKLYINYNTVLTYNIGVYLPKPTGC